MPGKSRRAQRKLSRMGKEKRRQLLSARASQPQAVAETYRPVVPAKVAAPSVSKPASMPAPAAVQHPYIASELRRIGILAGIMLAILITLSLVLP